VNELHTEFSGGTFRKVATWEENIIKMDFREIGCGDESMETACG
jgi:hypothetical protein